MSKPKAVTYAREPEQRDADPETFVYPLGKWKKLDKALATPDAEIIVVAFPEVLGDSFTELVVNLGKVAESGKPLAIVGPSPLLKKLGEVNL